MFRVAVVARSLVLIAVISELQSNLVAAGIRAAESNRWYGTHVSGEESSNQIKMRANRLGVASDNYLYPETDMSRIRANINEMKPNYVVIDSVQTMSEPEITSAIGSVLQIRQVTLPNSCESLNHRVSPSLWWAT